VGPLFVLFVLAEQVFEVARNYRQRLLNTRVMLTLRRALFDRLLHLPLPRLWDMKTGGILSRIHRRRRHDDRAAADGHRLPGHLGAAAGDRRCSFCSR
jgi:hypothetical protein